MTLQSPRIYLYKITFEEVPYYYYGVHKEKRYNEYYMGSPKTNKWCWELYTPKKQILEIFSFTDEGWLESNNIEQRLIRPFLNDKWCLNENCGGTVSLKIRSENGKKTSKKHRENKTGLYAVPIEQKKENGRKIAEKHMENNTGIFSLTKEELSNNGKLGGQKAGKISGNIVYELGIGIFGMTLEQKREKNIKGGKTTGNLHKENKTGVCGLSLEQRVSAGRKGSKNTNFQVWECSITGHRSNPGGLTIYQKSKGIDTTNRIRIS